MMVRLCLATILAATSGDDTYLDDEARWRLVVQLDFSGERRDLAVTRAFEGQSREDAAAAGPPAPRWPRDHESPP